MRVLRRWSSHSAERPPGHGWSSDNKPAIWKPVRTGPLQNGQTVHWDSPGADYPGVQRSRSSQKCVAHAQPANPQHPRLLAPPTSHARVLECAGTECRRGCTEHPAATLRPTGSLPRRSAAIMSAVLFPRADARTLAAWERLTARLIHNG